MIGSGKMQIATILLVTGSFPTMISAASIQVPVSQSTDDAEETLMKGYNDMIMPGPLHLTSSDLEMGGEGGGGDLLDVGIRFGGVDVPEGSLIDEAFIEFTVAEENAEPTSLRVTGELTPDPITFSENEGDISTRPSTVSSVNWGDIGAWTAIGSKERTPDLSPIVQELISQEGWNAGNAMSFSISPSPGGRRTAVSFNGATNVGDTSQAPMLHVSFTEPTVTPLQAGDADQDLDFDQFDLIQVQQAAKYLSGETATWGQGDWNGAPGGSPGNPPTGNGLFDQFDIIAAQQGAFYLNGPYAATIPKGQLQDAQTSIVYDATTGELAVDAPAGMELTSINVDSTNGIFTGQAARNLSGSFDNDADGNIFKATFGGSFGSLSFGNVAQTGLSEDFVIADLRVVGSLAGGGDLGDVDLVYVPEPSTLGLMLLASMMVVFCPAKVARLTARFL